MIAPLVFSLLAAAGPLAGPAQACAHGPAGTRGVAPAAAATAGASGTARAPARGARLATDRLDRADERLARSLRARPSAARRIVRKREILAPVSLRASVERADPSVTRLAEALDRAASSQRRRDGRPGISAFLRLRMLAAGAASMRLHLPPPSHLL